MTDDTIQDRRDRSAIAAMTDSANARLRALELRNEATYRQHKLELEMAAARRELERIDQDSLDPTKAPIPHQPRHDQGLTRPGWDGNTEMDLEQQELTARLEAEPNSLTFEEFCRNRTSLIAESNRRGMFNG